ncbi:hypothetical protein HY570_02650 [Candidatus Micrarchaeota archaeon]|nr:hypothetical protein [Candidatus Micrarchaeota archaeon]
MQDLNRIVDLIQMRAFLQQRTSNLHDSIIDYYEQLGKEKYTVKVNMERREEPECVWNDGEGRRMAAFEVEFGSKWNLERAVDRLLKAEPKIAVIVMSSKARGFTYDDLKFHLINLKSSNLKSQKFLIFDIEIGKNQIITSNSGERRKIIKGRRNEHKEQD